MAKESELRLEHPHYSHDRLSRSVTGMLESTPLCSIASICGNDSYISTAYFAFSERLELFFLSPPTARHSRNVHDNPSVAVSVFDTHQPWDEPKRGLQIFGLCSAVTGAAQEEALELYTARFSGLRKMVRAAVDLDCGIIESKFYTVTPTALKIFDEPAFGVETWISINLKGEKLLSKSVSKEHLSNTLLPPRTRRSPNGDSVKSTRSA